MTKQEIPFAGHCFRGVIERIGVGNVQVAASSVDFGQVESLLRDGELFFTQDETSQWIEIDFAPRQLLVTHYALKTHRWPQGPHIKEWVVEGTSGGDPWEQLDVRRFALLVGPNKCQAFPVAKEHCCERLRIRQIGKNSRGDDVLALCRVEFFGVLHSPTG
jgi:hypothetical protein